MRIEPIKEHIGAAVEVSRSRLGDADVAAACREALDRYGVLVFPKIGVTDEEQLLFTDKLGTRLDFSSKVDGGKHGTDGVYTVTLNPEINRQQEYIKGTYFWHIDGLTVPEQPPRATLLSGRKVSAKGGDTHFANTYAAYEGLSDEEKAEIADLRVIHNLAPYLSAIVEQPTEAELARWKAAPVNEYPLVWTHQSGRKSLVMGYTAHHIKGMDLASGKALLQRLHDWAGQPKYVYVHKWQQGDLVIWDNYGTMHRATPYAVDSGREMHRTSMSAEEVLA